MSDDTFGAVLGLLDAVYASQKRLRREVVGKAPAPQGPPLRMLGLSRTALSDVSMGLLCQKLSSLQPREDVPFEKLELRTVHSQNPSAF